MTVRTITGDCRTVLRTLATESVHCIVTSPPYFGLRDYGTVGQIGLEPTPDAYVAELVAVFREVRRVLRKDGTCWLNLGDSYGTGNSGLMASSHSGGMHNKSSIEQSSNKAPNKRDAIRGMHKQLLGIPWRVAFALQADGWWLRQDIIWSKPNPMPESVTDRCTKAHEYLFLLTKAERYYFDAKAIAEDIAESTRADNRIFYSNVPGFSGNPRVHGEKGHPLPTGSTRNKRSVWTVATQPYSEAHFATFPPALIEPCILAGCPQSGTVLDPFAGAGTTGLVADRLQRNAILIELNPDYGTMAKNRIYDDAPLFAEAAE